MISSTIKLLGKSPRLYTRANKLHLKFHGSKPGTKLNIFINGEPYNHRAMPRNFNFSNLTWSDLGSAVISSSLGDVEFQVNLESGKFPAGNVEIIATELESLDEQLVEGDVFLSTQYVVEGDMELPRVSQEYSATLTSDLIAQSFFTYGVKGGCYITSLDLFFTTKDGSIPIKVSLHEMDGDKPRNESLTQVTIPSDDVKTDGEETLVKFDNPIYLEQDKEFAIVISSNSNNYRIAVADIGSRSLENNQVIFEQPYTGSLYFSQNGYKWIKNDYRILKFKLRKAKFKVSEGEIEVRANVGSDWVKGSLLSTTAGSNKIVYRSTRMHGYSREILNSSPSKQKITITPITTDSNASFNGIKAEHLEGSFTISGIIDEYTIEFALNGIGNDFDATSTGPITSSGVITHVFFENINSNTIIPSTIHIDPPQSGILGDTATADVIIRDGVFVGAEITNPGKGYLRDVSVAINPIGWRGRAIAKTEAWFFIDSNKPLDTINSRIHNNVPNNTSLNVQYTSLDNNYTRSVGDVRMDIDREVNLTHSSMVTNKSTALINNHADGSLKLKIKLEGDGNSPQVNLGNGSSIVTYGNKVNDQGFIEDLAATNWESGLVSVSNLVGGSNYVDGTGTVLVEVIPDPSDPNIDIIVPAQLESEVSGNSITSLNILNPGSGYGLRPTIKIAQPPGAGIQATAQANISPVNTELNPKSGSAKSRYITREIRLKNQSTGIKLISSIKGNADSRVDWYIKGSLSNREGLHSDNNWVLIPIESNQVLRDDKFSDIAYRVDKLPAFDTYSLKCVISSRNSWNVPTIENYRAIITL